MATRKLTPQVHNLIVQAIALGARYEDAAQYAGVHPATLYRWLGVGRAERDRLDRLDEAAPDDADPAVPDDDVAAECYLYDDALRENGRVAITALTHWRRAMAVDWRAARDFLDRRFAHWRKDDTTTGQISSPSDAADYADRHITARQAHDVADALRTFTERLLEVADEEGVDAARAKAGTLARAALLAVAGEAPEVEGGTAA